MALRTVSSMMSFRRADDLKLLPIMGEPYWLLDYQLCAAQYSHHRRQCFNGRIARCALARSHPSCTPTTLMVKRVDAGLPRLIYKPIYGNFS